MIASPTTRPIAPHERARLETLLGTAPTNKETLRPLLSIGIQMLILLGALWAILAWVGRKLFGIDFGLHSTAGPWIALSAFALCAVLTGREGRRQLKAVGGQAQNVRTDLEAGLVQEERYVFTEAKRFQEPEHGGLMYFLRTIDERVFVLFDYESQNLGVDNQDPLKSSFRPQSELVLVRAPTSNLILSQVFSGRPLELPPPKEITVPPERWPESEAFCSVPWGQLEDTFVARRSWKPTK